MRLWIVFAGTLLTLPAPAWAHGGGHAAPDAEAQTREPVTLPDMDMGHSMPDKMDADAVDDDFYGVGSAAPLKDEVPLDLDSVDMEDHAGHDMAGMPEVEVAKHQWISTSQKGYGLAVGITLIAGLGFFFLSLKRPFE